MANPALLIIDIQNDYFPDGSMPLHAPVAAAEQAARVLERFRQRDWPRFHIQHESIRPGAGFMIPGTEGQAIHPLLTPESDEPVVIKHFPSAFQETSLGDQLQAQAVDELVVCGMMTHMCIDTSVRAAFERGYTVQLIADATATRSLQFGPDEVSADQVQSAFLAALHGTFAQVLSTQAWLQQT